MNGVYNLKKYNRGNDINLTLDADICKTAYEAMDGRKGTIAVYNYKTGAMVCMVSTPSYDPQNKPDDIDENSDEYEGVYLNRFVSGLYTPGSIFKVVTAISAIENIPDIYSQTFECNMQRATAKSYAAVFTAPSILRRRLTIPVTPLLHRLQFSSANQS